MSFLVDSDICSAYLKGNHQVWQRFMQYGGRLHLCAITVGELFTWALRSNAPTHRLSDVQDLFDNVSVLQLGLTVAREFGRLRAELLDAGRPTSEMDLWIAATATLHGLTVVTHNVQDFAHIPGLTVEDWLAP